MKVFVHYKIQRVEGFFDLLSNLNQLHQEKQYAFSKAFYQFTDDLIEYFEQIGATNNKADIEQLKNYYALANTGVSPISLEKIKTERRALVYSSAYHCLSAITSLLQKVYEDDNEKIKVAQKALGNLTISLIQANAITQQELANTLDTEAVKNIWSRVTQNEQIKIHEQNLKLNITQQDIYLILEDLLNKIQY